MLRPMRALFVAILLLAVPAYADPALWVARSSSATVYLFGTVHVLPVGEKWMDAAITAALAASTEVWTEADISDLSSSVNAIRHYGLGAAQSTEQLLPEAYRARYRAQAAASGMPEALLAQGRPWLVEVLLTGASLKQAGPMSFGAEAGLLAYAREHHEATPTFETVDQQFAILADMPQEAQLASLENQIDESDNAGPQFRTLLAAWRAGDDAGLDRLINQQMRASSEIVWTELILRRNERFAQRIAERLAGSGTAFVAVGVAHLCGSVGVPRLLLNQGFSVERVR